MVITGAMKPSDITGYDGPANVEAAARVAVHPQAKTLGTAILLVSIVIDLVCAERVPVNSALWFKCPVLGVLFVENDQIHAARYVYKADSNRIGAFHSTSGGPLGSVHNH